MYEAIVPDVTHIMQLSSQLNKSFIPLIVESLNVGIYTTLGIRVVQ